MTLDLFAAAQPATSLVCGVDEAGRGPLCGPVMAAAVILDPSRPILGLNDSKKLSEAARERSRGVERGEQPGESGQPVPFCPRPRFEQHRGQAGAGQSCTGIARSPFQSGGGKALLGQQFAPAGGAVPQRAAQGFGQGRIRGDQRVSFWGVVGHGAFLPRTPGKGNRQNAPNDSAK